MYLSKLILRHFRNYEEQVFEFSSGINIIQGENAQGKTNLLEAIYLLSTGRSFRTTKIQDLVQSGRSSYYLEAHFVKEAVEQKLTISFDGTNKKITYNQTPFHRFVHLLGILPGVLLAPEDISLVMGAPQERRRFLDLHIAQTDPLYVHHLARFYKAMKQRNHLLRKGGTESIEPWEIMMAQSASYLLPKRQETTLLLSSLIKKYLYNLSFSHDDFSIHYQNNVSGYENESQIVNIYKEKLQRHRKKEILLGSTLTGPHRDDLLIKLQEKDAKTFASEGQKRSFISALRFAEWELLRMRSSLDPILSIDDFGVHLDPGRIKSMASEIEKFGQVFITSPNVSTAFTKESYRLLICQGKLL